MCSLFNVSIPVSPSSIGKSVHITSIPYYYGVFNLNTISLSLIDYLSNIKSHIANFIKVFACYYVFKVSTIGIFVVILLPFLLGTVCFCVTIAAHSATIGNCSRDKSSFSQCQVPIFYKLWFHALNMKRMEPWRNYLGIIFISFNLYSHLMQ